MLLSFSVPYYTYRFEDGRTQEVFQSITEDAIEEIDGEPVKRVYSAPGIVLKGSGFYRNGS